MRGLGRLLALPWLLIALAVQGLAPAQAEAMPRDAFGLPICSAHDLGGGDHRGPAHDRTHDCCVAACALVGLAGGPSTAPLLTRAGFGLRLEPIARRRVDAPASLANRRPNARGPPASASPI